MKSFSDLPAVEFDPSLALCIEDGIPTNVDTSGYGGPRRLTEVLELAAPASGVAELVAVAKCLHAEHVHVLRLSGDAGGSRLLNAGTHECLSETGASIVGINIDDALVEEDTGEGPTVARLVALLAFDAAQELARPWARLAAHLVMQRAAGITLPMPKVFYPSEAAVAVNPHWWGLPYAASDEDAEAFARHVAGVIGRFEVLRWALCATSHWLSDSPLAMGNLAELLKAFDADRPQAAKSLGLAA